MLKNLFEKDKRLTIVFMPEKKRSTLPNNIEIFYYFPTEDHFLVLYLSILFFYTPNVEKFGFKRIVLKIAL